MQENRGRTGSLDGRVQYPVLIIHKGPIYIASIIDLECDAVGTSAEQVLEIVSAHAAATVRDHQLGARALPAPSHLTLTTIDVPMPSSRQSPDETPPGQGAA